MKTNPTPEQMTVAVAEAIGWKHDRLSYFHKPRHEFIERTEPERSE